MENLPPDATIEDVDTEIGFVRICLETMDPHADDFHEEHTKRQRELGELLAVRERKLIEPPRRPTTNNTPRSSIQTPMLTSTNAPSASRIPSSAFGHSLNGIPLRQYTDDQMNQNASGRIAPLPGSRSLGKHPRSEDHLSTRTPSAYNKSPRTGPASLSTNGFTNSPSRPAPGRIPSTSATPNGSRHGRPDSYHGPPSVMSRMSSSHRPQNQPQNLSSYNQGPILPLPTPDPRSLQSQQRQQRDALLASVPREARAAAPGPSSSPRRHQQLPGFAQIARSASTPFSSRPVEVIELSSDSDSEPEVITRDAFMSRFADDGLGRYASDGSEYARYPAYGTNRYGLASSTPAGQSMYDRLSSSLDTFGRPHTNGLGGLHTPPHMPGAYPSDMDLWDRRQYYARQGASEEDIKGLLNNVRDAGDDLPKDQRPETPEALVHPLMEHQKIGLHWLKKMEMSTTKGSILADDMGLGKTIQALALIVSRPSEEPAQKTTLIIAPVALMFQWELEIKTKIKEGSHALKVMIYHGQSKRKSFEQLSKFDIVLTSYGTVASEWSRKSDVARLEHDSDGNANPIYHETSLFERQAKWYRIILDEAQNIKNKETKTSRAVHELRAKYRLCMTGTPMMNRVDELYPMFRFLRVPSYQEWSVFKNDIKTPVEGDGDRGIQKLRTVLKATLLRRTKESIIDGRPILSLPPKTIGLDHVDFDEDQRDFYRAIEHRTQLRFNRYLQEGTVGTQYTQILVLLLRLRQACCHPNLIKDFAEKIPTDLSNNDLSSFAEKLSPEVVRRIKEENGAFSCPICLDATANPAIFYPCGHTSCSECFSTLSDPSRAQPEEGGLKCPQCRGRINAKEITDYNAFKKVHQPEVDPNAELNDLLGPVPDEDADSEIDSDDEEDTENSASSKGKGRAKHKPTLAELRKDRNKNRKAKDRYFRRLAKKWVSSSKIDRTMELLREIRDKDVTEKTLIFSQFTGLLDLLEFPLSREQMEYVRYDGSMSARDRNDAVRKFTTEANTKVMLVSLKAGNSGLNLVEGSQVIILDPFWNPYIEYQAIDRAHRIGQRRPVTVHRVLVPDTVEDRIMTLQKQKEELITAALDESQMKSVGRLNDRELRYLFGLGQR
ncbi:SNF2 family N-terminal domain-containing protein [Phyllosticta capitalensis]